MNQVTMKDDLNLYTDIKKLVYGRNRQVSLKQYSQFHEDMYLILLGLYDRSDISKDPSYTRSWIATEVIQFLIPNLEWLLDQRLSENDMQLAYKLWEKCMALASRKSFHHFLLYMELDRKADKQVYSNRQDVLGGIVFYLNKMQNEPDFMDLVGSFPPSFGKCVSPNTKVLTPKGNIKIKDLNVGDEVYSMQDREMVTEKVTNKWNTRKTQVKITTRSGKEIITSPEHRMFTDKGYKESKDLTVDDYFCRLNEDLELVGEQFTFEPIVKIEYVDEEVDMVDIEVSNTHNFIANGYVSHNSFVVNYFSAWELGRNENGSILRLSYSDDLLNGFSRSIKSLIMEDRFKEIFPRFEKYGNKPFSKDKSSDWLLKGSDSLASHYTRTRDGAVTGVRAKSYIILDDMTKGADEANNETVHQKYWDQYTTEWRNRKENDLVKEVVIGTMWNPKDILGRKGEQLKNQFEERDSRFPYIKEYINGKGNVCGVVIRVPLLDEDMKSTCEDIYTTQTALNIKEDTDEFLFSCVYQQNPISPTGRLFAYDNLMQYEFEGNYLYHNGRRIELSKYSYASLDPVRKGIDFVAMPIFKYDVDNPHIYYLVDTLFQGKSMDEVYSEITSRVLQHDITRLVIENNTDTSLAHLVDKNLKNAGYYYCDVTEKFQTTKKEQRIRDENLPIRKQIVFPKQGMFPQNSEMGRFMSNITSFSVEQPNKHDDAPDSVALFVSEIVKDGYRGAKVEATRRPLGL